MSSDRAAQEATANVGLLHELPLCKAQHDDDHVAPPAGAPGSTPAAVPGSAQAPAPGSYAPPPGPPPTGQPPYPQYAMPPGGYYPPPGGYYPPPPGQYPGYYPYGAPPPGQYPPPPGQYGQYPPAGYYPPPPGAPGAPGTPGAPANAAAQPAPAAGQQPPQPGAPATSPVGGFAPPPGAPPAQAYPPPGSSPYAMPVAVGGYPPAAGAYYPPPPPMTHPAHRDPLVYLGTSIPDPEAPPAQLGVQKVHGYDPTSDYNALSRALISGAADEKQRQSPSSPYPSTLSPVSSISPLSSTNIDESDHTSLLEPLSPSSPSPSSSVSLVNPTAVPLTRSKSKPPPSSRFLLNNRLGAMLTLTTDSTRAVLNVMKGLNIFQIDALNDYCTAKSGISLADKLERTTSGNFGIAIRALALGPLWYDVDLAHKALAGLGTNETLLIELILGRPGHEIRWLKTGYRKRYGRDLVDHVKSDLSGKLERLFIMALNTQKPDDGPMTVVDPARVNADIHSLHQAAQRKDEITFCEALINRSNAHIAAVITGYGQQYKSLSKVIKKTFSGTMEQALLYIMHGVKAKRDGQGYWRDAKLLEKSMAGLGTKDVQLIYRLTRAHWDPRRMECVKEAYKRRYGKPLENRVKGETSGLYRDLLVELVRSGKM